MKKVNKKATKVLDKMRSMMTENYLKLSNNDTFMPVVVERVGSIVVGKQSCELISVAHYGEQNGDLMRDPEIVFIRDEQGNYYPESIIQDYIGVCRKAVTCDDEGKAVRFNPRQQRDIAAFTGMWMENIRYQQGI
ncbi:MAG: hypothetical protein KKH22_06680 [Proteobacteria bacterium]|nr:hypothetical protein [Pseudomonadota bacterium]